MRIVAISLVALGLLVVLTGTAFDDDEKPSGEQARPADPGIVALHDAISEYRHAVAMLRDECVGQRDKAKRADCRKRFAELRAAFKDARRTAMEMHHAWREAQRNAPEPGRPSLLPKPSPTASPRT